MLLLLCACRAVALVFRYSAATCIVLMPVVLVQVTDHYPARRGGVYEVIIGQVYPHVGNAPAVYMKEYKITLYGIAGVFYTLAGAELVHRGAQEVHAVYIFI